MYKCCSDCDYYVIFDVPEMCEGCVKLEDEKKLAGEVALLDNGDITSSNV